MGMCWLFKVEGCSLRLSLGSDSHSEYAKARPWVLMPCYGHDCCHDRLTYTNVSEFVQLHIASCTHVNLIHAHVHTYTCIKYKDEVISPSGLLSKCNCWGNLGGYV